MARKQHLFAIVCIVVAMALGGVLDSSRHGSWEDAQRRATHVQLHTLAETVELYRESKGVFPAALIGLTEKVDGKPLLERIPNPWATPYHYSVSEDGPDLQPCTGLLAAEVTYH